MPPTHLMRRGTLVRGGMLAVACSVALAGVATATTPGTPTAKQAKHAKKAKKKRSGKSAGYASGPTRTETGVRILTAREVPTPLGVVTVRGMSDGQACVVTPPLPMHNAPAGQPGAFSRAIGCNRPDRLDQIWLAWPDGPGTVTMLGLAPGGQGSFTIGTGATAVPAIVTGGVWTATHVTGGFDEARGIGSWPDIPAAMHGVQRASTA